MVHHVVVHVHHSLTSHLLHQLSRELRKGLRVVATMEHLVVDQTELGADCANDCY